MFLEVNEFVKLYVEANGLFYVKYLYSVLGFVEEGGCDFGESEFIQEIDGDLFYETLKSHYGLELFLERWHGDHLLKRIGAEYLDIVPREFSETGRSQYKKYKTLEEAIKDRVLCDLKKLGIKKIKFMGEIHEGVKYQKTNTKNTKSSAADPD